MVKFSDLDYNVGRAIDYVKKSCNIKFDETLSKAIHCDPKTVARCRKKNMMSLLILVRLSEHSGIPTRDLRYILGDRRVYPRRDLDVQRGKFEAIRSSQLIEEQSGYVSLARDPFSRNPV
jgi:hypothetical protein